MSPTKIQKKVSRTTSPVLRKILVGLLFISTVTGYASVAYFMFRARSVMEFTASENPEQLPAEPDSFNSLLKSMIPDQFETAPVRSLSEAADLFRHQEAGPATIQLTFQGALHGKNGAIAMINNEPAAVGSEIQGVKVIAIDNKILTLEYKGDTQDLSVGQTVSIELR
jgi:hypothetical protein